MVPRCKRDLNYYENKHRFERNVVLKTQAISSRVHVKVDSILTHSNTDLNKNTVGKQSIDTWGNNVCFLSASRRKKQFIRGENAKRNMFITS